jgi:hypothetical protein
VSYYDFFVWFSIINVGQFHFFISSLVTLRRRKSHGAGYGKYTRLETTVMWLPAWTKNEQEDSHGGDTNLQYNISQNVSATHLVAYATERLCTYTVPQFVHEAWTYAQFCQHWKKQWTGSSQLNKLIWPSLCTVMLNSYSLKIWFFWCSYP